MYSYKNFTNMNLFSHLTAIAFQMTSVQEFNLLNTYKLLKKIICTLYVYVPYYDAKGKQGGLYLFLKVLLIFFD